MDERELFKLIEANAHPITYRNLKAEPLIERLTASCTGSLAERLYWLKHKLTEYPRCLICQKQLTSKSFRNGGALGYRVYCSRACSGKANQSKIKATSLERYGVDSAMKLPETQEKQAATNLARYGEAHPNRWSGERFKASMKERYGVEHPLVLGSPVRERAHKAALIARRASYLARRASIIDEAADRGLVLLDLFDEYQDQDSVLRWSCSKCGKVSLRSLINPRCEVCDPRSKPQSEIVYFLRELLGSDEIVKPNDRTVLQGYELDIYVDHLKLAIELNGAYWHSSKFIGPEYHLVKLQRCEELGIRLLHVWDHQWYHQRALIEARIKAESGLGLTPVDARSCSVENVSPSEAKRFMDQYHLQESLGGAHHLGLWRGDELISVMSLGAPRFNKKYSWELLRFASLPSLQVRGGASRLLAHFRRAWSGSIISYADRALSAGRVYRALGFQLVRTTAPGYFYVHSQKGRLSRYQAQKHKLSKLFNEQVDLSKTEEELLRERGWHRVYDCGQLVFELI